MTITSPSFSQFLSVVSWHCFLLAFHTIWISTSMTKASKVQRPMDAGDYEMALRPPNNFFWTHFVAQIPWNLQSRCPYQSQIPTWSDGLPQEIDQQHGRYPILDRQGLRMAVKPLPWGSRNDGSFMFVWLDLILALLVGRLGKLQSTVVKAIH